MLSNISHNQTINKIKNLIKDDIKNTLTIWNKGGEVYKKCYHVIDPTSVLKSQMFYQITNEMTEEMFGQYNSKHPNDQKKFETVTVLAPLLDSKRDFMIPILKGGKNECWLYADFIPQTEGTYGLFIIDECSHANPFVQPLLWQIQNEYAVHRHAFPKGWFVISIDNASEFLNHAIENNDRHMVFKVG